MQRRLLLLALAASFAASAQVAPLVEPQVHATEPFDTLVVDGAGQVRLFLADHDEVIVPGDKRLVDGVKLQRTGTTLTIVLPRGLGNLSLIEVRARHLTRLTLAGDASVSAPLSFRTDRLSLRMTGTGFALLDNLETAQLVVDLSGSAEAHVAGKVDNVRLTAAGKSRFVADRLRARSAEVTASDSASVDVWAADEVDLRVADSGRIRYWGRPSLMTKIAGQGSIAAQGPR